MQSHGKRRYLSSRYANDYRSAFPEQPRNAWVAPARAPAKAAVPPCRLTLNSISHNRTCPWHTSLQLSIAELAIVPGACVRVQQRPSACFREAISHVQVRLWWPAPRMGPGSGSMTYAMPSLESSSVRQLHTLRLQCAPCHKITNGWSRFCAISPRIFCSCRDTQRLRTVHSSVKAFVWAGTDARFAPGVSVPQRRDMERRACVASS